MKCRAQTYKYHTDPCQNAGRVDGYCYLHHPEVLLAKFRYQLRAGFVPHAWRFSTDELKARIAEQERLLAEAEHNRANPPPPPIPPQEAEANYVESILLRRALADVAGATTLAVAQTVAEQALE